MTTTGQAAASVNPRMADPSEIDRIERIEFGYTYEYLSVVIETDGEKERALLWAETVKPDGTLEPYQKPKKVIRGIDESEARRFVTRLDELVRPRGFFFSETYVDGRELGKLAIFMRTKLYETASGGLVAEGVPEEIESSAAITPVVEPLRHPLK